VEEKMAEQVNNSSVLALSERDIRLKGEATAIVRIAQRKRELGYKEFRAFYDWTARDMYTIMANIVDTVCEGYLLDVTYEKSDRSYDIIVTWHDVKTQ
jgi:hypothetical protein